MPGGDLGLGPGCRDLSGTFLLLRELYFVWKFASIMSKGYDFSISTLYFRNVYGPSVRPLDTALANRVRNRVYIPDNR